MTTRSSLAVDLRALGVRAGSVLLVHASLSSLGWVCGGPVALVQSLLDALGRDGTLLVPTHTGANSDPAGWRHPPVPEAWWQPIRDELPGYHPKITPSNGMGVLAETVRGWPGAQRSDHPLVSFAAVGPEAEQLTAKHRLAPMFGEGSPVARLEAADGDILLLGVDHAVNSSLHLAESRVPGVSRRITHSAATQIDGNRRWTSWEDLDFDSSDFAELGAAYEMVGAVTGRTVGQAQARLMRQRPLVAFAQQWLAEHRPAAKGRP